MELPQYFKKWQALLLILVISLAVFSETSVPYIYAQRHTPAGMQFRGQLAYIPDQAMYFSFIGQARDGKFVFNNRLTGIPNPPVFINLEFWFVGFIQRVTGISSNAVYHVWRYLGALLLTLGIYLFASVTLSSARKVIQAMVLLVFSGGFGFVFALLSKAHLIGFDATQNGIIDMRYGLLPLQQMISNPHFALPHGLILIAYVLFLMGEKTDKIFYYAMSGFIFTIIGLVRPYDLIPPVIIFPLFILLTNRPFRFNIKLLFRKLLPLFMIVPVFLYNLWLFKLNDIFKYWAQQGLNANISPGPVWSYLGYGIIGILAIIRLLQFRTNPLDKSGKFLVVLFGVTFVFIQLGKIIPAIGWSPQIGVYLSVPLAMLGCSAKPVISSFRRYAYSGMVCVCIVASNISIVMYFIKNFDDERKLSIYYTSDEEMNSLMWLKQHTTENEVVVADVKGSQCIAKYTSARVVIGHYSVTPHFDDLNVVVGELILAPKLGIAQKQVLSDLNADYIYIGPLEKFMKVEESAYLSRVYTNSHVTIYKINRKL